MIQRKINDCNLTQIYQYEFENICYNTAHNDIITTNSINNVLIDSFNTETINQIIQKDSNIINTYSYIADIISDIEFKLENKLV